MAHKKEEVGFDLDLAVMEDDALVVLAKECGYEPARDELIVRYGAETHRFIGWLGYKYTLNQSDAEDARQVAVFWIIEAITKYDTSQIGKNRGCSFRSFIHRVILARFKDFAKHLRRVECHYDRSARCGGDDTSDLDADKRPNDPATICEAQESMNRLHETILSLDDESAELWRLLASGHSLRKIAEDTGISYDCAKRRRRNLIDQLRKKLNPGPESTSMSLRVDDGE